MTEGERLICEGIDSMDENQLAQFVVALKAILTLPELQAQEFHDMVISDHISVPEAATRFGIVSTLDEFMSGVDAKSKKGAEEHEQ